MMRVRVEGVTLNWSAMAPAERPSAGRSKKSRRSWVIVRPRSAHASRRPGSERATSLPNSRKASSRVVSDICIRYNLCGMVSSLSWAFLRSFVQIQKDTIESVENEFASATENQALKQRIIARISDEGPITFREFTAIALYEPRLGYYCTGRETMGRAGDYLTSPEVSPIFGAMVGRQLREMWEAMGSPARWDVVEAGAGNGTLCRDILRWARQMSPEFFEAIRYLNVEPIPALASRQRELVAHDSLDQKVCWPDEMPDGIKGCVLSNDPYARIGRQDMTGHLDFTSLRHAGEASGLKTLGLVSQSEFLINLGIGEAWAARRDEPSLEERLARRRAVSELVDPTGLGRIKVLVQAKGIDGAALRGLSGIGS